MPPDTHHLDRPKTGPDHRPVTNRPDPCADNRPACPACGGLECLCRPRFFPGQLLTDEDLNRLEGYVVNKNKLHARYLHGWGVACGLEVACDACSSANVVVRAGYALSPCGDDIVVCRDHSVNVCELIDQCRPQRGVVCDPPAAQAPRECREGIEQFVLAICYDERPSRGITALTGSTDTLCCTSCGGGGSCGCGGAKRGGSGSCGCGGGAGCKCGARGAAPAAKKKPYKPQCEPTQICEGYRFIAYPKPKDAPVRAPERFGNMDMVFAWMYANRAKFGPMLERLLCCVTAALQLRESFSRQKYPTGREAHDAYFEYLDALRDFAAAFALHNCAFLDKLDAETHQDVSTIRGLRPVGNLAPNDAPVVAAAMQKLDRGIFDLIAECFCSALLPACPEPAPDNCVPLAVITVRTRDCHVVEICNWEARKLLITWRTVGYWLSWLPWHQVRASIAKLCCADTPRNTIVWPLTVIIGIVLRQARTAPRTAKAPAARGAAPADEAPMMKAMASPNLMEHFAKGFEELRAGKDPEAPEWASLLARLADGSAFAPLAGQQAQRRAELGDIDAGLGIEALRRQVAALQEKLDGYEKTLGAFRKLMRDNGG